MFHSLQIWFKNPHHSFKTSLSLTLFSQPRLKLLAAPCNFFSSLHNKNLLPPKAKPNNFPSPKTIKVQKHAASKGDISSEVLTVCCCVSSPLSVSNLLTGIIHVCRWPVRDRYLPQHTTCCLILNYCVKLGNSIFGSQTQTTEGQC